MKNEIDDFKNENTNSLRLALQKEMVSRCQRNPAYSLRAFARFLELDQSLLSKILRGQRSLSPEVSLKVLTKLGFKPSAAQGLLQKSTKTPARPLPDDEFELIKDWQHFAILELAKTKTFKNDPAFIAKRLQIHIEEARAAIERLQRLGLVENKKDKLVLTSPHNNWDNTALTTEARKLLQKRLLELGIQAIETVPYEVRENGSLTIAIDKNRLPEFKAKLTKVREELAEFFQPNSNLNEVYQLTMSFFPLTKHEGD